MGDRIGGKLLTSLAPFLTADLLATSRCLLSFWRRTSSSTTEGEALRSQTSTWWHLGQAGEGTEKRGTGVGKGFEEKHRKWNLNVRSKWIGSYSFRGAYFFRDLQPEDEGRASFRPPQEGLALRLPVRSASVFTLSSERNGTLLFHLFSHGCE